MLMHTAVAKLFRYSGIYLLNLFLAFFGATSLEEPLYGVFHWKAPTAILMKEYVLSGGISFALGYFVYHRWRTAPSRWLWVAGVLWLGLAAVLVLGGRSVFDGMASTIYRGMSGIGCVPDVGSIDCANYFNYMMPSLRVIWYSMGALSCAKIASLREARLVRRP